MRPTKYNPNRHPVLAKHWAMKGATARQIARKLKVSTATLYDWARKYPEFQIAVEEGRVISDARVTNALYERALGYDATDREIVHGPDGSVKQVTTTTRHVPGDVRAIIFWLTNRQPKLWCVRKHHTIERTPSPHAEADAQRMRQAMEDPIARDLAHKFERRMLELQNGHDRPGKN